MDAAGGGAAGLREGFSSLIPLTSRVSPSLVEKVLPGQKFGALGNARKMKLEEMVDCAQIFRRPRNTATAPGDGEETVAQCRRLGSK